MLDLFEEYHKYISQPPPSKRPRLRRVSSEPAIQQSVNAEYHPAPASIWRYPACPEVKVIQQSTPKLVKTLSGFVANVSDECLSEGLITESVNKMLLESISSSEDKVRKLLQAVRSSISVDRRCYKIFVSILNTTVPPAIRDKLVSEINIKYKELLKSGTDPEYPKVDSAREHLLQEVELATSSEFKIVVDEFKEAVEKHIRTCIEKERLEKELVEKCKENEKLKKELEMAKASGIDSEIRKWEKRFASCESEIAKIQESIAKLDKMIEEHEMIVKRSQSFAQVEYREISDSHAAAKKANDEKDAKIQELRSKNQRLKGSNEKLKTLNEQLKTSMKNCQVLNDCLHAQLHNPLCQCMKDGKNSFAIRYPNTCISKHRKK